MLWGTAERTQPTTGKSVQDLYRATSGSAGLDLCAASYTVLTPEMGVQALPTGVHGPLPPGTMGLILGRSSSTIKGLFIAPGVIDEDYTGEIKIMTHSPSTISVIQSGQRIAQLILLPYARTGHTATSTQRGTEGFGSSDLYWVQAIKAQRPELTLTVNGRKLTGYWIPEQMFRLLPKNNGLYPGQSSLLLHSFKALAKLLVLNKVVISYTGRIMKVTGEYFNHTLFLSSL